MGGDGYGYRAGFSLHAEIDAARAYGCLLEFKQEGGLREESFICDAEFIADRCLAQLEAMERQQRERAEQGGGRGQVAGLGQGASSEDGEAIDIKEARRQQRERERDEAIAAHGANLELGAKLAERFHAPKLSKQLARLLALLVFEGEGDSIAARGLRYVEPKLQQLEERELKSGGGAAAST